MLIPQNIFNIYNNTISDLITNNVGVPCTLIYGSNRVQCPNCIYNSIAKTSSNIYNNIGPQPFTNIICPYCNGIGFKIQEQTEDIFLRVYFTKKDFLKIDLPIISTDGLIQTIGFISDMPKLQKAKEIIANINVKNYSIYRYQLAAEIIPWGLGQTKKFCIAFWKRSQ